MSYMTDTLAAQAEQSKNNVQKGTKIDYLTEDKNLPPGQLWVCVSFLSPEGVRNCTVRGLKIRGVFADEKEARDYAAKLQGEDPLFHIFVGEMGKWLPWDPNPNSVKDQNYYEDELQKLMKSYVENKEKAKKAEEQRRQETLQKSVVDAKRNRRDNERQRLRKKLDQSRAEKEMPKTENKPVSGQVTKEMKEKEDLAEKEKQRLKDNEARINNEELNVKSLDENINKIKAIYENMQKKKSVTV